MKDVLNAPTSLEKIIAAIDHSLAQTAPFKSAQTAVQPRATLGKHIIFTVAEEKYAVPINQVMEVGEPQRVTPVPNVPSWVLGVTNLRGDIISVVDCGAFLNLHERISMEAGSVCVVRNQRRDLATSLMVERIEGMLNLSEDLMALPETLSDERLIPYLQGVYEHEGQFLKVLNLEDLLAAMALT